MLFLIFFFFYLSSTPDEDYGLIKLDPVSK